MKALLLAYELLAIARRRPRVALEAEREQKDDEPRCLTMVDLAN
jgi:hypothetical protein